MHYDEDIMASLQIRELPDDLYRALSNRAKRDGRSLAQQAVIELRRLPEMEANERRKAVLAEIRGRTFTKEGLPDPVDLIREDRDA